MINIRVAQQQDMKAVLGLITELAIYEKEPDAVIVTEGDLITHGFLKVDSTVSSQTQGPRSDRHGPVLPTI